MRFQPASPIQKALTGNSELALERRSVIRRQFRYMGAIIRLNYLKHESSKPATS
ncbi:MAG TPA: hypothetical protein VFQ91_27520 [Bryobacteraceae bacterium]|nr:hypothetical protein [Bryobacteraceae bacterium]